MTVAAPDTVPLTQARTNRSELAEQVKAGVETITTRNGDCVVALIDANQLDDDHALEREQIHLLLLDDARRGLADIAQGRTEEADQALARLQRKRAGTAASG